jgi:5'/3'-nucleotidase SurE
MRLRLLNVVGAAATAASLTFSQASSALNIALTNDDGWDSIGITAMKKALDPDHDVTLAAPLDGQSGSSAALDLGPVEVTKQAEGVFSVAGEPATSALIAMDIAGEPDLLISGINDGANIGTFTQISGTVGAATVALSSTFNGSIPAIAISTDPVCEEATIECEDNNKAHFEAVANFVANLVKHLMTKPGFLAREEGLLPYRVGLNINYPPTDNVKGVKVSTQGQTAAFGLPFAPQINFTCDDCGTLSVGHSTDGGLDFGATVPDNSSDVKNGDRNNYEDGFITIVPIQGDLTAGGYRRFKSVVNGFNY